MHFCTIIYTESTKSKLFERRLLETCIKLFPWVVECKDTGLFWNLIGRELCLGPTCLFCPSLFSPVQFVSPVCGAEIETSHLAWQRSVSVTAVVSIKSWGVVVLSVPSSISVSIAVDVVGSGVSVIQVSGLGGRRGRRFSSVWWFTTVTAVSTCDGMETLKGRREETTLKKHRKN